MTYTKKLQIPSQQETQILDITEQAIECIAESGIRNGIINVHAYRSTCAIGTVEFESEPVKDWTTFSKNWPRDTPSIATKSRRRFLWH